jgi:hypothetical protein
MLFIVWREERRVMMVEPPGQPFVGTIFEIDDRVVVTFAL